MKPTRIVACLFTYLTLREPRTPLHEILEELADELFRCLIRQITLGTARLGPEV